MPSLTESVGRDLERAELETVLQSPAFVRSPALAHLLSYLCEKVFAGEIGGVKEYSIALEVFGRKESFDQDTDSIVRVQANRLRKRLAEYYCGEGATHSIHISIPIGQYVPLFEDRTGGYESGSAKPLASPGEGNVNRTHKESVRRQGRRISGMLLVALGSTLVFIVLVWFLRRPHPQPGAPTSPASQQVMAEPTVGLPVGEEVRILAGANRNYIDHSGKLWHPDAYFAGGTDVRSSIQHIWRTQDPAIYRNSRQGDFTYQIPLNPGIYELHLHFAEMFYGPESAGGGGEGSRVMAVSGNGKPLLTDFDVLADAGEGRTADVKVFTGIVPSNDGLLHLVFSSVNGGRAMVSAIEILPGSRGHLRPIRIATRSVSYYSNDSHWWSADTYFKGGQPTVSEQAANDGEDPELYETARWGHFSYAIPVTPGKYTVTLHFIERWFGLPGQDNYSAGNAGMTPEGRIFDVFCNGKSILRDVNILESAGENQPLERKITGLEPNAQGKLVLEFVPIHGYAIVTAIEVVAQ